MRLTILLPSLNEAGGIEQTMRRIPRDALERAGYDVEVLVVDGQSTDGTPERARAGGARVVTEPRRGYGRAYKTGFREAKGDFVVTADADDTYPLDALPDYMVRVRERGLDFVTLDRTAEMAPGSMSFTHVFGNAILTTTARLLYHVRLKDSQSGMWILTRRALDAIAYESLSDGMAFSQELKIEAFKRSGLRCAELPGRYYPRVGEEKLMRWSDGLGNLRALWRHRLRSPGRNGTPGHSRR